jgi:hypothetical protein
MESIGDTHIAGPDFRLHVKMIRRLPQTIIIREKKRSATQMFHFQHEQEILELDMCRSVVLKLDMCLRRGSSVLLRPRSPMVKVSDNGE